MACEISPPPLKRRRLASTTAESASSAASTRVTLYSWNINGIGPFVQQPITAFFKPDSASSLASNPPSASLRAFCRAHDWPSIVFLQEVKIRSDDSHTISAVRRAISPHSGEDRNAPDYVAHFTLPKDPHNARGFGGKVYGVCSIIRKDFADTYVNRVRDVAWDSEGRFSVVETKQVGDVAKVAIFNVYMVNGTDNPYKDSATGKITGTRHDRKREVHALLAAECRELMGHGFEVIIAGDINIARSELDGHPNLRTFPQQHVLNRVDFHRHFIEVPSEREKSFKQPAMGGKAITLPPSAALGMIDVFRELHPNSKAYSYYPRGRPFGSSCDRVDMILCSVGLASSCTAASILATSGDRGSSDHVPIHVTLDFGRSRA